MKTPEIKYPSLLSSFILIAFIIMPYYFLYKNDKFQTAIQSYHFDCMKEKLSYNQLCINCIQRRKLNISHTSIVNITKKKSEFSVIKIPKTGRLDCFEILNMINYRSLNKIDYAFDLQLQTNSAISQIFKEERIQWSNSINKTIAIPNNFQQIVVVEISDRKKQLKSNFVTFMPRQTEIFMNQLASVASQISFFICSAFLTFYLFQQRQKQYHLLISIIILMLVYITSFDQNIYITNKQTLIHQAKVLFFGLIFIKIGFERFFVLLIMVSFSLLGKTAELTLIIIYLLLFILYKALINKQKDNNNGQMFMILCLVLFASNVWMKQQNQFSYIALSIIIEYNLLIVGTVLVFSLKSQEENNQFSNLPNFDSIQI